MPSPDAIAVFSDIHSNFQALEAMLNDMRERRIARTICLGDIVGYAAQPRECVEIVRTMECPVLKGNHDSAVVEQRDFASMRDLARTGIEFSRTQLPSLLVGAGHGRPIVAAGLPRHLVELPARSCSSVGAYGHTPLCSSPLGQRSTDNGQRIPRCQLRFTIFDPLFSLATSPLSSLIS